MQGFDIDPDASAMLHESDGLSDDEPGDSDSVDFENAALDNLLDEFIEVVNARDLSQLEELLSPSVEAEFLGERSLTGVVEGLGDLVLRYPSLVLTRGDLDDEPVVAAWAYDTESDRYDALGYFTLQVGDGTEPLIERLDYVEEFAQGGDLLVEEPERSELAQWDEWSELDES
ncbi:MAG TPA: hypothetical protein VIL12_05520 [Acidimicrobiia bacterium]